MTTETDTDQTTYDDPISEAERLDATADDLLAEVREAFADFEPFLWRMDEAAQKRATATALRTLAEIEPEADAPRAELDDARQDLDRFTTRLARVEQEIRSAQMRVDDAQERSREAVLALNIDTASAAREIARELRGVVTVFVRERRQLRAQIMTARGRLAGAERVYAEVAEKVQAARTAVDKAAPDENDLLAPWLVRGLVDPDAHPVGSLVVAQVRTRLALLGPMATLAWGMAHLGAQTQDRLNDMKSDPMNLRYNSGLPPASKVGPHHLSNTRSGMLPAHPPIDGAAPRTLA